MLVGLFSKLSGSVLSISLAGFVSDLVKNPVSVALVLPAALMAVEPTVANWLRAPWAVEAIDPVIFDPIEGSGDIDSEAVVADLANGFMDASDMPLVEQPEDSTSVVPAIIPTSIQRLVLEVATDGSPYRMTM